MTAQLSHSLQPLSSPHAVSGCWKLAEGRALTLRPAEAGELRVAHGMVWVTFDQGPFDDSARGGDHFFGVGESIRLLPGQALVVEAWGGGKDSIAYFSWDPLPAAAALQVARAPRRVFAASGVVQPLRDLRLAFGMAAGASARLAAGLAGVLADAVLAVLPRPLTGLVGGTARTDLAERAFRAQSSDSRAQCAIS
ncbi:MAG TPA: DUF2917 domain-containing protein [Polaromonas sp.]|uniref:DUF2917 domain-containing protein n=1 Tax=Polaromonas sp. TaxID=1869339 RepID=UPI002D29D126|nr:DUF2917 domain-containing protein [Polaromonas sp.]HYW56136.1 DUF2917 domain-containing protein [Polaromonas sp.]